ncbi:MAG: 50S ribosomal protein L32e [Candidatus Hodarchaeota archaeon]
MSIKRNKIKKDIQAKKKKTFRRQESWRYVRTKTSWRKPRGIECKMRIRHRGSKGGLPVSPTVGYRTPKEIRGIHPSGYETVMVTNESEIEDLKPKYHAAIISAKVGRRKKIILVDELQARGIKILNKGYEEEIPIELEESDVDLGLTDVEDQEAALDDIELSDDIDDDVDDMDDDVDDDVDSISYSKEDLQNMTLGELKEVCKSSGIKGYSKLKKDELIDKICEEMEMDD